MSDFSLLFLSFRLLGFRISRVPISSRTWIMWKPTALPVWSIYLDSIHDQSYSLCTFQEPTLLIPMSQSEPPWPLVKLPSYHLDWWMGSLVKPEREREIPTSLLLFIMDLSKSPCNQRWAIDGNGLNLKFTLMQNYWSFHIMLSAVFV